jgi:hypothetical protein
MAQIGWVFLDDHGGRHRVGLYHGDRTGHVLIHCESRIVQVDFSIKESRTYSFFIEDELCEIQMVKENGAFSYAFEVNKKVDTPRNRLRRLDEKRNRKYMAILIGCLCVVLGIILSLAKCYDRHKYENNLAATSLTSQLPKSAEYQLNVEGKTARAQLFLVNESHHRAVYYGFMTRDSLRVSGKFMVPDTGSIILPNGFPLSDRDAFEVVYLPSHPQTHQVNYFLPSGETLDGYFKRATEAEAAAHPDQSLEKSACIANVILHRNGWQSLVDLLYQTRLPEENARYNRDSYLRLVRDPEIVRMIREQCLIR